ncbi:hypothetical protein GQ457_17G010010 [Hibiscus cannabinus]
MVFDEIRKRDLRATVVSFNTLINGYCKLGDLEEGFRLKSVMEDVGICPNAFTYSSLIIALCKESRLDDVNVLFDEMCNRGLIPNGFIFTSLIDGKSKSEQWEAEIGTENLSTGLELDRNINELGKKMSGRDGIFWVFWI